MFEWYVMMKMISAQHGQRIEEIMYDNSNENTNERLSSKKFITYTFRRATTTDYQKYEKCLKFIFLIIMVLFTLLFIYS